MEHGGSEYDCRRILGWMVYLNDCDGGTRFFLDLPQDLDNDLYIHTLDTQSPWSTCIKRNIY